MTGNPGLFISVVLPLRNDVDIVRSVISEVSAVMTAHYVHYEIIGVDDGSSDGTLEELGEILRSVVNVRVIPLSRRFGQEIAIAAGLDSAIGDYVVVMLPDDDPPELIPAMVDRARTGVGMVFGVREDRDGQPWLRRTGSRLFYAMSAAQGLPIQRNATHFRVLSREAVNAVTRIRSPKRYLRTLSHTVGFGDQAFLYHPRSIRSRPRRTALPELARLAVDIVVTNTTWPLRAVSTLALASAAGSGCFAIYVVLVFLFKDRVAEGWTTIAGPAAVVSTILLLALGVIGQYLVRALEAQSDGPLYHALGEHNSSLPSPSIAVPNVVDRPDARLDEGS